MTAAAILFAYATVALIVGPPLLTRMRWPTRAPRIGIAMWLTWLVSILAAVALGGLVLMVPVAVVSRGLGGLLDACALALQAFYAAPGGAVTTSVGALLAGGMLARFGYSAVVVACTARRERRAHHDALTVVGRPHPQTGSVVVDDVRPAAYCVPGSPHRVVLTTAALAALNDEQLTMVLAHEHAHLRGRHHLLLALAGAMCHAFPLPPVRAGAGEIARLVEMLADDHAGRRGDRLGLAEALLTLGAGPIRPPALAAADTCVGSRVRRLLTPHRPLGTVTCAALIAGAAAMIIVPAFIATQPAFAAHRFAPCPPGITDPPIDVASCAEGIVRIHAADNAAAVDCMD
ncbi:M56 family metallopeptidase [Mycolicibacterium wolinskyi]|uniref:M56 family metallopeptidase n=1 Tax=Mycolicibacterium wolinskyi TaxID=59750 RepID=UPI00082CD3F5|nr:M56 family metallopeptidase [Mycolicibacterium wolinskyi]